MESSSQKDLSLVLVISLAFLALISLSPIKSYPYALIPYLLLIFLLVCSLIIAFYPKKVESKKVVTGFILGILLVLTYQIALLIKYITFPSEFISIWLLIFILIFCLITYFRIKAPEKKQQPQKEEKINLDGIINGLISKIKKKNKKKSIEQVIDQTTKAGKPIKKKPIDLPKKNLILQFKNSIGIKTFQGSKNEIILSGIIILILIMANSTMVYLITKPTQGEEFTAFYILGPDGKASNYPTNLKTGQQGKLTIIIVNHEYKAINYQLVVKMNNNITQTQTIALPHNAKKKILFTFTAGQIGKNKLEFLLYKLPDDLEVYRLLHI